jgi:hypothetical protein
MRDSDTTNAAEASLSCAECGYRNSAAARTCGLCCAHLFPAGSLAPPPPRAPLSAPPAPIAPGAPIMPSGAAVPLPYQPDPEVDRIGIDEVKAAVRERCIRHGWTGVWTVFGLTVLFGLPASLHPFALLSNAIASVLFGFPLGFLASYGRLGMYKGAMLGAAIGALFAIPGALLIVAGGGNVSLAILPALLLRGVLAGIIPGACIGMHVESDR